MKIYLSKSHSDEEGTAEEGKHAMIFASKEDLKRLCNFFSKVDKYLETGENCHMQFRDSFDSWDKEKHIDIELNLD